jgi:selenophosphate synthetase-related protein
VVTTRPENQERVLEVFTRRGLTARVIGRVTEERRLIIRSGEEESVLFDLTHECVTGIH